MTDTVSSGQAFITIFSKLLAIFYILIQPVSTRIQCITTFPPVSTDIDCLKDYLFIQKRLFHGIQQGLAIHI